MANMRATLFVFTNKAAYIMAKLMAGIILMAAHAMVLGDRTVMKELTLAKSIPANIT